VQGIWWLPSAAELAGMDPLAKGLGQGEGGEWGAELLQLAAKQRMNTDVRRTVFCVVMGSEDYVDASERLLRLPLKVCQPGPPPVIGTCVSWLRGFGYILKTCMLPNHFLQVRDLGLLLV